jgi:citrate lyase subunit beta/citryl-CoA lyase
MDKLRRTMLYCPASQPKLYYFAPSYRPDCIIFDLEDSVELAEKDGARDLLVEAVRSLTFDDVELFVRVNGLKTPFIEDDLEAVVRAGIEYIRLPMCETPEEIQVVDRMLEEYERIHRCEIGKTKIQVGIETPLGVINAREMATASERVMGLSFGAEDYTASLGVSRTKNGEELQYARSTILNVARAYGLEATDSVWADFRDTDGFKEELRNIYAMGYQSKACIHPSQIDLVHEVFRPSPEEIKWAERVLDAVEKAGIEGGGAIAVDGKMIDVPLIKKAKRFSAYREVI